MSELNIKTLLTETVSPQVRLMNETRALRQKWEPTGLLEGLNPSEKVNMAVLLDNQANMLIREASSTGTAPNAEQWQGVALPLVRRVFAEIAAKEFVSVQPMTLPSGLIYYLDFKYGTAGQLGHAKGESVYGGNLKKLGSTDAPVNGLYGQGRYGYSQRPVESGFLTNSGSTVSVTVASASYSDLNFDPIYASAVESGSVSGVWAVTIDVNDNSQDTAAVSNGYIWNVDLNAVRSFELTESGSALTVLNTYSKVINTGTLADPTYKIILYVASATEPGTDTKVNTLKLKYTIQPDPQSRGDFEAGKTAGIGSGTDPDNPTAEQDINSSIGIPELNIEVKNEPIIAKTRKLQAIWTPEIAQDLNAYQSIDAEAELTSLLSEYMSMEIDMEILDMLINCVRGDLCEAWSTKIGKEYIKSVNTTTGVASFTGVEDATPNRTAYVKRTWFETLINKVQLVSNKIHQLTLRGGANFLVCSPTVATILESIPGYVVNTDGDQAKFAMGVTRIGSMASRFQVYKNPYMTENIILVGFRGSNFLETGAVYAPYIPLIQTPLVYDPVNFTPRRGIMTRYAKKIVRPEFYGKIYVTDLHMI